MILLIGTETAPGASISVLTETVQGCPFNASRTGTVETIKSKTPSGANTATSVRVAIWTDVAGAPGESLGEATLTRSFGESETWEATGLSVKVTEGTGYFLMMSAQGGTLRLLTTASGTASVKAETPGKVKAISEVTKWKAETKGPMLLAGLGTEASGKTYSGALAAATGASVAANGLMIAVARLAPASGAVVVAKATTTTAGALTVRSGAIVTAGTASKTVSGHLSVNSGVVVSARGHMVAVGPLHPERAGGTGAIVGLRGSLVTAGAVTVRSGAIVVPSGRLVAVGRLSTVTGASPAFPSRMLTAGRVAVVAGATVTLRTARTYTGSVSTVTGATVTLRSALPASGVFATGGTEASTATAGGAAGVAGVAVAGGTVAGMASTGGAK